jgi:hypothetical protein
VNLDKVLTESRTVGDKKTSVIDPQLWRRIG